MLKVGLRVYQPRSPAVGFESAPPFSGIIEQIRMVKGIPALIAAVGVPAAHPEHSE